MPKLAIGGNRLTITKDSDSKEDSSTSKVVHFKRVKNSGAEKQSQTGGVASMHSSNNKSNIERATLGNLSGTTYLVNNLTMAVNDTDNNSQPLNQLCISGQQNKSCPAKQRNTMFSQSKHLIMKNSLKQKRPSPSEPGEADVLSPLP